ncbi:MAG: SMC-Scp complex subunit ScpB [Planctomycetia bacterium]|nr:SMC-Scp complex subunit ScpB [Planctomycetia bacterium]
MEEKKSQESDRAAPEQPKDTTCQPASSDRDTIISLNGQNVRFSGTTIQFPERTGQDAPFLPFTPPEGEQSGPANPTAAKNDPLTAAESESESESECEEATADLEETGDIHPFTTQFSEPTGAECVSQFDERFAAGLSSLFETSCNEEEDTSSDVETIEEEDVQEEEASRLREHLDGVLRQDDEDSLYELGAKFGISSLAAGQEENYVPDVCPRSILEAMLFVGDRNNRPLNLKRVLPLMRNVSDQEARDAIALLNQRYEAVNAPYHIVEEPEGFRMVLREEFEPVRERFAGKTRQFKLSQKAIDILALIAYRQPVAAKEILEYRPGSGPLLTLLVKRNLIAEEKRTTESRTMAFFRTTPRFLEIFHLASLDDLPIVDEVDYR